MSFGHEYRTVFRQHKVFVKSDGACCEYDIGGAMRRRNKLRVGIHFVWATKNRLPLISEDIERAVYRCIRAICSELKCECLAVGGMEDHVHLLVSLNSTVAMGQLMKRVKGGSSHVISESIRPGEWFAWQPNCAAFAVSYSHNARVVQYIENQKERHAAGRIWAEAEETDEEWIDDDP